ncbi:unnamed protein product [Brassica rapa subsp. trilocularis]
MASKNQSGMVSQICYLPLKNTCALCFCDINGFFVLSRNGTEYTHDGVSGQPVSLCHPGEANFRHRRRSFHQEQKISDWYRWIIPNVLNLSPYEILFIYILWRWT